MGMFFVLLGIFVSAFVVWRLLKVKHTGETLETEGEKWSEVQASELDREAMFYRGAQINHDVARAKHRNSARILVAGLFFLVVVIELKVLVIGRGEHGPLFWIHLTMSILALGGVLFLCFLYPVWRDRYLWVRRSHQVVAYTTLILFVPVTVIGFFQMLGWLK